MGSDKSTRKLDREMFIRRIIELITDDPSLLNTQLRGRGFKDAHICEARKRTGIPTPKNTLLTSADIDKAKPRGKPFDEFNPSLRYRKKPKGSKADGWDGETETT